MFAVIEKIHASEHLPGNLAARALAGSWRTSPPPLELEPAELEKVAPLLLHSGAGALLWWRLQNSHLRASRELRDDLTNIRQIYGLKFAQRERQLGQVLRICQSFHIDSLLIKGWAIAKQYPNGGLRPTGDIDLCVAPARVAELKRRLFKNSAIDCAIDLDHTEITHFGGLDFGELYERSLCEEVDGVTIRIPCPEDHLRILCLHALKHGAWRPLWLCDIAVALESRPQKFDWERCLGRDPKHAWWIICALALACRLLGADGSSTPAMQGITGLPQWMVTAVLKQWNSCRSPVLPPFKSQMRNSSHDIHTILQVLKARWPNPIQATVDCNGAFTNRDRWVSQVQHCAERAWRVMNGGLKANMDS